MPKKPRTTVTLDDQSKRIIDREDINVSEFLRSRLKREFDTVSHLEQRLEEIEARDDRLLEKQQDIERRRRELDKERRQIQSTLTRNKVIKRMKEDPEVKRRMDAGIKKVRRWIRIKEKRSSGLTEETRYTSVEEVVEETVAELSDDVPGSEDELRDALRVTAEAK